MRVGSIIEVEEFSEARKPAYKLTIDFGELGMKKSSAQVRNYAREELIGRMVVAVTNFPPKQIGNFFSEVLVLSAPTEEEVNLLIPSEPEKTKPGDKIA